MFKHPHKKDLYIALADRWIPDLPTYGGDDFASGRIARGIAAVTAKSQDPTGRWGTAHEYEAGSLMPR